MHCSFDFVFVISVFPFHVATLKPTCPYRGSLQQATVTNVKMKAQCIFLWKIESDFEMQIMVMDAEASP